MIHPQVAKQEANEVFWKLYWLIEDNIGTENMELVYSQHVDFSQLPVSLSNSPRLKTRINLSPLSLSLSLFYLDGIPYIEIVNLTSYKPIFVSGTYKYTGDVPYELSEECLNNTYFEWSDDQNDSKPSSKTKKQ